MMKMLAFVFALAATPALAVDAAALQKAADTYAALELCVASAMSGGDASVVDAMAACQTDLDAALDAEIAATDPAPSDGAERAAMAEDLISEWAERLQVGQ